MACRAGMLYHCAAAENRRTNHFATAPTKATLSMMQWHLICRPKKLNKLINYNIIIPANAGILFLCKGVQHYKSGSNYNNLSNPQGCIAFAYQYLGKYARNTHYNQYCQARHYTQHTPAALYAGIKHAQRKNNKHNYTGGDDIEKVILHTTKVANVLRQRTGNPYLSTPGVWMMRFYIWRFLFLQICLYFLHSFYPQNHY